MPTRIIDSHLQPLETMIVQPKKAQVQAIDLAPLQQKAKISRDGISIVAPEVNEQKIGDFIARIPPIKRPLIPRVVAQNPVPGTLVAPGTRVNLTLLSPADVPVNLFDGMHIDLGELSTASLLPMIEDPRVKKILQTYEDPKDVPAEQRQLVSQVAEEVAKQNGKNFNVGEGAERNFDALHRTLQLVAAFG